MNEGMQFSFSFCWMQKINSLSLSRCRPSAGQTQIKVDRCRSITSLHQKIVFDTFWSTFFSRKTLSHFLIENGLTFFWSTKIVWHFLIENLRSTFFHFNLLIQFNLTLAHHLPKNIFDGIITIFIIVSLFTRRFEVANCKVDMNFGLGGTYRGNGNCAFKLTKTERGP